MADILGGPVWHDPGRPLFWTKPRLAARTKLDAANSANSANSANRANFLFSTTLGSNFFAFNHLREPPKS
jgi:hypothetical protein